VVAAGEDEADEESYLERVRSCGWRTGRADMGCSVLGYILSVHVSPTCVVQLILNIQYLIIYIII
jgi:hypothetical protein